MNDTALFTVAVVWGVATVSACSTSKPGEAGTNPGLARAGGSQVQCKSSTSNPTATDKACTDCSVSNCLSELQAAYGSEPTAFGGACSEFSTCSCNCAADDLSCGQTCFPKLNSACRSATEAISKCAQDKCKAACAPATGDAGGGSAGGRDSGSGGGAQVDAGGASLRGGCTGAVDQEVYPGGRACTDIYSPTSFDYGQACSAGGETFYANGCPSAGRVGRCTANLPPNMIAVQMYYNLSAADAQQACTMYGGTFQSN